MSNVRPIARAIDFLLPPSVQDWLPERREGRLSAALRKQRVEPIFGIIKSVMGFRQFLTRGLDNVQGEWTRAAPSAPSATSRVRFREDGPARSAVGSIDVLIVEG